MKSIHAYVCIVILLFTLTSGVLADGTVYGPHEFRIVTNGMAPNRQFSIAAHGSGEDGEDNFHIYLVAEPSHKIVGPLEEVDPTVDTDPSYYTAVWSPDSRHVMVIYRWAAHFSTMRLYRIEHRRAFIVKGPDVLDSALAVCKLTQANVPEERFSGLEVHWISSKSFVMSEDDSFRSDNEKFLVAVKKFADTNSDNPSDPNDGPPFSNAISADATCELQPGDKYRISSVNPAKTASGKEKSH